MPSGKMHTFEDKSVGVMIALAADPLLRIDKQLFREVSPSSLSNSPLLILHTHHVIISPVY